MAVDDAQKVGDAGLICAHCWLPIRRYGEGWRHYPGPRKRVPNPGHEINPIPAESLRAATKGAHDGR